MVYTIHKIFSTKWWHGATCTTIVWRVATLIKIYWSFCLYQSRIIHMHIKSHCRQHKGNSGSGRYYANCVIITILPMHDYWEVLYHGLLPNQCVQGSILSHCVLGGGKSTHHSLKVSSSRIWWLLLSYKFLHRRSMPGKGSFWLHHSGTHHKCNYQRSYLDSL